MDAFTGLVSNLDYPLNVVTILISFVAVIYWVKLFKRISISGSYDEGWLWIFASVLMVLLLNLSTMLLVASNGRIPLGKSQVFFVDVSTLGFVGTLSRTIMAVSMTIGAYLLYGGMKSRGDVKFEFKPIELKAEDHSLAEAKYQLKPGSSYMVVEGSPGGNISEYYIRNKRRAVNSMELFVDLVTHGIHGFMVSRSYPKKIRQEYGLFKTPILWMTQEKGVEDGIHPTDLAGLSHMIKDFIWKAEDSVVLIHGIEYLILHNSFEDTLKMIQGLDDVVVRNNSRLIIAVDPSAIKEQHYHLLTRELIEYDK